MHRCNAYHDRFLHLCVLLANIKEGLHIAGSVLFIADSPQHEPNHHISGFLWQRCVSSEL